MTRRMLLIDDDARLVERLALALSHRGHVVRTAPDGPTGLALASTFEPQDVVLDLRMPGIDGLEVLASLRDQHPDARIVLLTGYGSIPVAVQAIKLGAVQVLQKPASTDQILAALADDLDPQAMEPPSLARTEWEHIQRVLDDCGGNISEAARQLGLHRRTLQRKLQKFPPRR